MGKQLQRNVLVAVDTEGGTYLLVLLIFFTGLMAEHPRVHMGNFRLCCDVLVAADTEGAEYLSFG